MMPLAYYQEYDEVILDLCQHFLDMCPPDVDAEAKHKGYEPFYFGGNFPAAAAFEMPFEDEPHRSICQPSTKRRRVTTPLRVAAHS
jgi:hypothetical protein